MLVDRDEPEEVFARVPEVADQTDAVRVQLDRRRDDDDLYPQVRRDLVRRSRLTPVPGRHSPPGEVLRRRRVVTHRDTGSVAEPVERVADSLVWRGCCRGSLRRAPDATTLRRGAQTIRPTTLQALLDRGAMLAPPAPGTPARPRRVDAPVVDTPLHSPTDSGR